MNILLANDTVLNIHNAIVEFETREGPLIVTQEDKEGYTLFLGRLQREAIRTLSERFSVMKKTKELSMQLKFAGYPVLALYDYNRAQLTKGDAVYRVRFIQRALRKLTGKRWP